MPIIEGALSWVACSLRDLIAGGDHTIAIGQVAAMDLGEGDPLVWYGGQYHDVRLRIERWSAPRRTLALDSRLRQVHRQSSAGHRGPGKESEVHQGG